MVPVADTNLTVVIVSAVAAIFAAGGSVAAAVVAWKLGVRRFDHERSQTDRTDARETLAAGALSLGQAKGPMKDALTAYEKGLSSGKKDDWPPKDEFYEYLRKLEAEKESLERALAAVRMRFEQTEDVVETLAAAAKNLSELITAYWLAWSGRGAEEGDGGDYAEALTISTDWDGNRDAYLESAQAAVGVRL